MYKIRSPVKPANLTTHSRYIHYQVTHISTTQQQLSFLELFIRYKPKGSTGALARAAIP